METPEQEVEALKKWWHENGRTVVIGVVVGLGAVIGWNTWQGYRDAQAERASQLYTEVVNAASARDHARAIAQARAILEEFPASGYAALAALVAAAAAEEGEQAEEAKRDLRWVAAHAPDEPLQDTGRVRLARVLLGDGDRDGATAALGEIASPAFAPLAAELRGDAALAAGDREAAVAAYREALAAADLEASLESRVRMKLDDLGAGPDAASP